MKKVALLTIGLLMVCNCAFASVETINIDMTTGSYFSDYVPVSGSFEHDYKFSLTESFFESFSESFVSSYGAFKILDITDFTMNLYNQKDLNLSIGTPSLSYDGSDVIWTLAQNLVLGDYLIKISGTGSGIGGAGGYVLNLTASQVPVPAAALLLGAGLLGIVGIRRRQSV